MIFRNEKYGESKHYSLVNNGFGVWTIREFKDRKLKTQLTLNTEEYMMFKLKLKEHGWYEHFRR